MIADTVIADRVYDTDRWVINLLHVQGKIAVILPKRKRCNPHAYAQDFYKARQRNRKLMIPTEAVSGDRDTFV